VRAAEGRYERLPSLAAELVSLKPSVIVTSATPAAIAAKNATSNIPIVALVVGDPVGTGLVTNIARPEGNVTGLSLVNPELGVKRLDLLKQALPHVSRVGVLSNPLNPQHAEGLQELEAAAKVIRVSLTVFNARSPEEIQKALSAAVCRWSSGLAIDSLTRPGSGKSSADPMCQPAASSPALTCARSGGLRSPICRPGARMSGSR